MCALASSTVCSPKWKIEAASTASAPPSVDAVDQVLERAHSARGDHRDAHGVGHRRGEPRSKPSRVPSRSMRREQDLAGAQGLGPAGPLDDVETGGCAAAVGVHLPPLSAGWHRRRRVGVDRASMATTTHWLPNSAAISAISSGRSTAAVLTDTLSAPARSSRRASSTVRMPPPTVNGMNTCSAVRRTTSTIGLALVGRRGDVEEDQLVGALGVVAGGQLDRVAGVAQVDEVDALDHPAGVDVEAGDDPGGPHPVAPVPAPAAGEASTRRTRTSVSMAVRCPRRC